MRVLLVRNKSKKHQERRSVANQCGSSQRRQRRFPAKHRLYASGGRKARLRLQLCFVVCTATLLSLTFLIKRHSPLTDSLPTSHDHSDSNLNDLDFRADESSFSEGVTVDSWDAATSQGRVRVLESASDYGSFPRDLIPERAKDRGAIIVHILVAVYMFYGIAVVCDDFFVSSLEIIIDRLQVKEDVAGATFMAAGGSAPELFTSIIGTFIAQSDVGFGTIVGSAVFNVLFVIGICAFGSGQILNLDWYPLSRDSSYYTISLLVIVVFVWDQQVELYEAILLFLLYLGYIVIMFFNETIERKMKARFGAKVLARRSSMSALISSKASKATVLPAPEDSKDGEGDKKGSGNTNAIASKDGPGDGNVGDVTEIVEGQIARDAAVELQPKSASDIQVDTKQLPPLTVPPLVSIGSTPSSHAKSLPPIKNRSSTSSGLTSAGSGDSAKASGFPVVQENVDSFPQDPLESENISTPSSRKRAHSGSQDGLLANAVEHRTSDVHKSIRDKDESGAPLNSPTDTLQLPNSASTKSDQKGDETEASPRRLSMSYSHMSRNENDDDEEDENPFEFPDGKLSRFWYILKVPVLALLYSTIPDCRKEKYEKYYVITFSLSLVWIAVFTWLMVWMATEIGITFGIPPPVMGLTILAAGTSVPDAVSSLVVAKQGFGDMAVSSSIGSNIFDILVGLPIPWMFYAGLVGPVRIESGSLVISVAILLAMVIAVIVSIHLNAWVLTPRLGFVMVVLYCIFVTISLLLEYGFIPS